jgi:hypothetical protein
VRRGDEAVAGGQQREDECRRRETAAVVGHWLEK